jgi:hypothetical protein
MDHSQYASSFDLEQFFSSQLGFEGCDEALTSLPSTTSYDQMTVPLHTHHKLKPYCSGSYNTLPSKMADEITNMSQEHLQQRGSLSRNHVPPKLTFCQSSPTKWTTPSTSSQEQLNIGNLAPSQHISYSNHTTHSRASSLDLPHGLLQGDSPLYSPFVIHAQPHLSQADHMYSPPATSFAHSPSYTAQLSAHHENEFTTPSEHQIDLESLSFTPTYMIPVITASSNDNENYANSLASYFPVDHPSNDEEIDLSFTTISLDSHVAMFSTASTPVRLNLRAKFVSCSTREFFPAPSTESGSVTDVENRPYVAIFRRNHHAVEFKLSMSHVPTILCDEHARMHAIRSFNVQLEAVSCKFDGRQWHEAPVAFARISEGKAPAKSSRSVKTFSLGLSEAVGTTYKGSWDRLQFDKATGGNGKKISTQAYYVYRVRVNANTVDGATICVGVAESRRLVVYGRNPGSIKVPGEEREETTKKRRGPRKKDGSVA